MRTSCLSDMQCDRGAAVRLLPVCPWFCSAVTLSREPGWLEGVLEGKRGLIPENYVEIL